MNYTDVKTVSLAYADRTDSDTDSNMDSFMRIVESRVNRHLRTMGMESTHDEPIVADQREYDLPANFGGARQISWRSGDRRLPVTIITPEQYEDKIDNVTGTVDVSAKTELYGYISNDKLHIHPAQETGNIHFQYYLKVPELTSSAANNWLSDDYPDCYVFGLSTEINAYVKDAEAKALWDGRFKESLREIKVEDQHNRWSGQPLQIKAV